MGPPRKRSDLPPVTQEGRGGPGATAVSIKAHPGRQKPLRGDECREWRPAWERWRNQPGGSEAVASAGGTFTCGWQGQGKRWDNRGQGPRYLCRNWNQSGPVLWKLEGRRDAGIHLLVEKPPWWEGHPGCCLLLPPSSPSSH